jgi:hypothetical protein
MAPELVGDTGIEPVTSSVSATVQQRRDQPKHEALQVRPRRCEQQNGVQVRSTPLKSTRCSHSAPPSCSRPANPSPDKTLPWLSHEPGGTAQVSSGLGNRWHPLVARESGRQRHVPAVPNGPQAVPSVPNQQGIRTRAHVDHTVRGWRPAYQGFSTVTSPAHRNCSHMEYMQDQVCPEYGKSGTTTRYELRPESSGGRMVGPRSGSFEDHLTGSIPMRHRQLRRASYSGTGVSWGAPGADPVAASERTTSRQLAAVPRPGELIRRQCSRSGRGRLPAVRGTGVSVWAARGTASSSSRRLNNRSFPCQRCLS